MRALGVENSLMRGSTTDRMGSNIVQRLNKLPALRFPRTLWQQSVAQGFDRLGRSGEEDGGSWADQYNYIITLQLIYYR